MIKMMTLVMKMIFMRLIMIKVMSHFKQVYDDTDDEDEY